MRCRAFQEGYNFFRNNTFASNIKLGYLLGNQRKLEFCSSISQFFKAFVCRQLAIEVLNIYFVWQTIEDNQ